MAVDEDMNNSPYRRDSSFGAKREGWPRYKKIGISIIVLLAIIVIVSTAANSGNKGEPVSTLSQHPVTSDEGQPTEITSDERYIDQQMLRDPDG
jgi:hypothetical protein